MASTVKVVPSVISIVLLSLLVSVGNAQQQQKTMKAVQLTGLMGVKDNTQGSLAVENGNLALYPFQRHHRSGRHLPCRTLSLEMTASV